MDRVEQLSASRVSSPFQSAGARSLIARSIRSASVGLVKSSSAGHYEGRAAIECRQVVEYDRRLTIAHATRLAPLASGCLRRQLRFTRSSALRRNSSYAAASARLCSDQVLKQLRHLVVETRIRELIADDRLADVVDDAFGNGVL